MKVTGIVLILTTLGKPEIWNEIGCCTKPIHTVVVSILDIRQLALSAIPGEVFTYGDGSTAYVAQGSGYIGRTASGPLLQGSEMGIAASVLSLITNVVATAFVIWKSWYVVECSVVRCPASLTRSCHAGNIEGTYVG